MAGVRCCQRACFVWFTNSTRKVLTGRVKLYRASSRAVAALRKRSSFEKERVLRTSRPFICRAGQMRSFYIRRMTSYFLFHFFWISIDNFDAYAFQFSSFPFLNDLDIIPVFSWPRKFWWRSSPTILWYFSPGFEHRFPISSFSISDEGWWTCERSHIFLLVASDFAQLLLPFSLWHVQPADGSSCLSRFHSKRFLLHLLPTAPFFSLMTDIGPEGVELSLAECMLSHKILFKLFDMRLNQLYPSSNSFFLNSFNSMDGS